ncbi:MAG: type III pantothenate kinase [Muribaculaceae bacterium]|nr:type III pantothenate kinase [Muribaculaceae bacterium]
MKSEAQPFTLLTIDQGNSSAKAVVWQDGEPVEWVRFSDLDIEALLPILDRYELEGCAFCSVSHNDAKFLETLRRLLDGRLVVLTPALPLPIKIRYSSRSTLGSDRVAAAVGAVSLFSSEALLVVDAGTAITLDFVSADGEFLGGNIAPGMKMRFDSLSRYTSRLPLVEAAGEIPLFGEDTLTAIRCGVERGMAAEVADAYRLAYARFGCRRVVMTGADAELLSKLVMEKGIEVTVDKFLVGRGLKEIYRQDITHD